MMTYEELDSMLLKAQAGSRAAECHGFLTGYLCVSETIEEDLFRKFLLSDHEDSAFLQECVSQINILAGDINAQISSGEFELELLLPDDEVSLGERGAALTQWCQGFLSGLGIGGVVDFESVSGECRELIEDLYRICWLDVESTDDVEAGGETALMELVEFVRVGAIFIHEEFHDRPSAMGRPEVLH